MKIRRYVLLLSIVPALFVACAIPPESGPAKTSPVPITPAADAPTAPVVRVPVEPPAAVSVGPTAPLPSTTVPAVSPALPFPADVMYMCLTEEAGQSRQFAIEFIPKVLALCRKHPEMGPCQYEREVCRRAGGRVFAADGSEITPRTEEEYDKRVLRVRFRAN